MHMIQIFNPLIKGPLKHNSYAIKAFGDLYYDLETSSYDFDYIRFSTSEAMRQIAQIESWAK